MKLLTYFTYSNLFITSIVIFIATLVIKQQVKRANLSPGEIDEDNAKRTKIAGSIIALMFAVPFNIYLYMQLFILISFGPSECGVFHRFAMSLVRSYLLLMLFIVCLIFFY